MKKPLIYLGGPIEGLKIADAKEWREKVKSGYSYWFEFIDPTDNLDENTKAEDKYDIDMANINRCDGLLVNYTRYDRQNIGTEREIQSACDQGIPVYAFFGENNYARNYGWNKKNLRVRTAEMSRAAKLMTLDFHKDRVVFK